MYIGFGKGATSYELQIHKVVFYWTFLKGKYWRFKPWRRFHYTYFPEG